jgi:glutamine amidotransferase
VIAVIDYKAGNLASVVKSLAAVGADAQITEDPEAVLRAEKIVLPGVGHFGATTALADRALRAAVEESVRRGTPLLGICVGMQWLFAGSTEAPGVPGLGAFAGMCERFPDSVKVPHVGWNSVEVAASSRLLRGVSSGAYVYFTHSYRAPLVPEAAAVADYAGAFSGAVERDNIFGVQFHPEKSGETGLRVLRNFVELPC